MRFQVFLFARKKVKGFFIDEEDFIIVSRYYQNSVIVTSAQNTVCINFLKFYFLA